MPPRLSVAALLCGAILAFSASCGVDDALSGDFFPGDDGAESEEALLASAIDAAKPAHSYESRKSPGVMCFARFETFKRQAAKAGRRPPAGHEWHHIVNQNPANRKRFADRLQCTDNLIALPRHVHKSISAHYQSKRPWTGGERVRDVLGRRSWQAQYDYGLDVLRDHGIEP